MKIKKRIEQTINIFKKIFNYLKSYTLGKIQAAIDWVKDKKRKIDAYSAQSTKNKQRVRIYFVIAVVIVVYFVFSIVRGTIRGAMARQESAKERVIPVYTFTSEPTTVTEQFKINGSVMAENSVNIMPDIGGKLVRYTVQVGDTVTRGQTVAYVDPSRPGTIYNLSPVVAPLDGTISSLPIELGNTVTTTTVIGQLGDLTQLKIEIYVPERFVEMIEVGKEATVTTVAFPNDIFKAQIYELAPTLDPQTRTLLVKLRVTEGQGKLLSGMFAELLINARTIENVLTVPAESIVMRSGKTYVYIINNEPGTTSSKGQVRKLKKKNKTQDISKIDPGYYDGKAQMVAVETGIQTGDDLVITAGLNPGDRVVYSGQDLLSENALARILVLSTETDDPINEPGPAGLLESEIGLPSGDDEQVIDTPSSVQDTITTEYDTQSTANTSSSVAHTTHHTEQGLKQSLGIWLENIWGKIKTLLLDVQRKLGGAPVDKHTMTNPNIEATEIIIEENPKQEQNLQALPVEEHTDGQTINSFSLENSFMIESTQEEHAADRESEAYENPNEKMAAEEQQNNQSDAARRQE